MSDEELEDEMFSICQKLHEQGYELESEIAIRIIKCREFFMLVDTYRTVWLMTQKIRRAMAFRDSHYTLGGTVEADEIFIGG